MRLPTPLRGPGLGLLRKGKVKLRREGTRMWLCRRWLVLAD